MIGFWNYNSNEKYVIIIDARSQINAIANRAKGGGYENEQIYTNCKLRFASIENIHSVRDSYTKWFSLCEKLRMSKDNKKIMSKIESTGWNNLVHTILSMSAEIACLVNDKSQSVLVHCSDGWDRTAQLWSLSEMMLDPYYRTLEGFEVIIEKEWLSFGHKFSERWGHYISDSFKPDERSPVFIQFLDCVFQLINQFPTAFQFNEKLLLFLAHHVYTCKFDTFLFDNERTRFNQEQLKQPTTSIWTFINDNCYDFLNPFYSAPKEGKTTILRPITDTLSFTFWRNHFWQWVNISNYKPGLNLISPEDHKEELMKDVIEENLILKKHIKQLEEQLNVNKQK